MKKYEKPYIEDENIEFFDIILQSLDTGDVDESDDDFTGN